MEVNKVKQNLDKTLLILNKFNWLINCCVLDFYVDDHWNRLPASWKSIFQEISPKDLSTLLNETDTSNNICLPLSILALKCLIQKLNIARSRQSDEKYSDVPTLLKHPKLKFIFEKHLKPKKRHEINKMSQICYESARKLNVDCIVDFGAGLGHLSRILGYGYSLKMFCLEQQEELNRRAELIDTNLERLITKYIPDCKYNRPMHLTIKVTKNMRSDEFRKQLLLSLRIENRDKFRFGIVGLHPCGDLAVMLMRIFLELPEAKFINLVGCCYMKLTEFGYPLSRYLNERQNICRLSYESLQIACHAIEVYHKKLANNNIEFLRIHSYRAAIEQIIISKWPSLRHSGLCSIKYNENLDFFEYCKKAVMNLHLQINDNDITTDVVKNLNDWHKLVIFYTLRLMLAPLVETVVLLDRALFILENNATCKVTPIFDPHISPRNHITTCTKL